VDRLSGADLSVLSVLTKLARKLRRYSAASSLNSSLDMDLNGSLDAPDYPEPTREAKLVDTTDFLVTEQFESVLFVSV
jgi:hypothetical protein